MGGLYTTRVWEAYTPPWVYLSSLHTLGIPTIPLLPPYSPYDEGCGTAGGERPLGSVLRLISEKEASESLKVLKV